LTSEPIRIGTRGSLLALQQSGMIGAAIEKLWPGVRVELRIIKTTGDRITDVPLASVGGKGLFVKEIEDALLAGEVDLAVHSMKDVPAELPEGLEIGITPEREDPRDVVIAQRAKSLADLAKGASVGTSSLRRAAQVLCLRPDCRIETLRGNLDTRLRKLKEGRYDAIVLAAAGIHRMGWRERITEYLDPSRFVPAIGQGALGIEIRGDDARIRAILAPLDHAETAAAVAAERSLLRVLEGGCQVPIGAHARVRGDELELSGMVCALDGSEVFRAAASGARKDAVEIGRRVAMELLDAGARRILDSLKGSRCETG
jgi:hydroxymethylbilane synthase